ncbi:dTDP-4-dehydrorhamnose 3,5-epimerase [Dokdonia sinensis]|uniref:dTDP-4-dehydrorhamnose 3,5-epimerase n=1 Tax=Dokdonia sinensis TaxID=2479847 RepID=A0A3M0FYB5_9FLAO|nr:dTDP-4-dehydrorhamnose 3,5-epimerase [Dokdonia sinensis]RMB57624.1 dTDP-4-dehydrorhamnose 3,5-epimerase [Dokdonia sinensis]
MEIIQTAIPDVKIIAPRVFKDERGYFFESFNKRRFTELVGNYNFVQDNQSQSTRGVLRGLHYQIGERAQAKLVQVLQGEVLDVAVDIRKGSPTFGKHVTAVLSSENKHQMLVPRGFAHGFLVLSDIAIFSYKCDNYYDASSERGIIFNDPALHLKWGDQETFILSEKDKMLPLLQDADVFEYNTL